jgi:hypothetical protein
MAAIAAAVVTGPTLWFFDGLDDLNKVGELIWEGLILTSIVVVSHIDSAC